MIVTMMRTREVLVCVDQPIVPMQGAMRRPGGHCFAMPMLVMHVMSVSMFVLQCLVRVLVAMPFRQVQPDPRRHEQARVPISAVAAVRRRGSRARIERRHTTLGESVRHHHPRGGAAVHHPAVHPWPRWPRGPARHMAATSNSPACRHA